MKSYIVLVLVLIQCSLSTQRHSNNPTQRHATRYTSKFYPIDDNNITYTCKGQLNTANINFEYDCGDWFGYHRCTITNNNQTQIRVACVEKPFNIIIKVIVCTIVAILIISAVTGLIIFLVKYIKNQ